MSSTAVPAETALVVGKKDLVGVVTPPSLDRPVASLVQNIQKVMETAHTLHKELLIRSTKTSKRALEHFVPVKHIFRTECESLRQVLQTGYRHATDYATSSQRAPNDRSISAKRCYLSAKGVLQDVQDLTHGYEKLFDEFRKQRQGLTDALKPNTDGMSPSPSICPSIMSDYGIERQQPWRSSEHTASSTDSSGDVNDPVSTLYTALEGVQSSLRDIQAFWDHHVSFLVLLVNRQTNFPAPGEETTATVELWVAYQAALIQASSSISESADAMSVDPQVAKVPLRRHTYPMSNVDQQSTPSGSEPSHPVNPGQNAAPTRTEAVNLFRTWIRSLFQFFGGK